MVRHTLKILQHLLQDFKSVSDHFGTLCINWLKDTNLPFGSESTLVIPSRPRWTRKNIPFVWLSPEGKKMGSNQLFLVCCIWLWLIWVSVKILMTFFGFCKVQVPYLASRDLWRHQHGRISCCNTWKIRRKFVNSVSRFAL